MGKTQCFKTALTMIEPQIEVEIFLPVFGEKIEIFYFLNLYKVGQNLEWTVSSG